jgi:hypothetical protein
MPQPLDPAHPREIEVDLHGYTVREGIEVATRRVQEAFENGYDFITLIHGSRRVRNVRHSRRLRRGGIKWRLRRILYRGEWLEYVYYRRSKKHAVRDVAMRLRLRPNSNPRPEPHWSDLPQPTYPSKRAG